ncbi:MAG: peptidoglycan recognition family protein [Pseudomonadota bacterium]
MPDVSLVISTLMIAAGLSLAIERILELINQLRNQESAKVQKDQVDKSTFSLNEAKQLIAAIRAVDTAKFVGAYKNKYDTQGLLDIQLKKIAQPATATTAGTAVEMDRADTADFEIHSNIIVLPATKVTLADARTTLLVHLLAAGLGIFFAEVFKINLVALLLQSNDVPHWLDMVLTGIVIGGGSQPIHVLMRFLSTRKVSALAAAPSAQAKPAESAAVIASGSPMAADGYWRPIVYTGGVKPATLEHQHKRGKAPDLIVYHHTAMASNVPFQGIVDEFLVNKGWSTGYHCVVMPDGELKAFCRWDRCGNHAKNFNDRSLGVAFHGNFHSDTNDRFSNHDGRYGNPQPTAAQLDAGGRLIALWLKLYPGLALDFNTDIVPHSRLIPGHTVCPGANFPHKLLQERVAFYYAAWQRSPEAQQQIAIFKQQPFIYANVGGTH